MQTHCGVPDVGLRRKKVAFAEKIREGNWMRFSAFLSPARLPEDFSCCPEVREATLTCPEPALDASSPPKLSLKRNSTSLKAQNFGTEFQNGGRIDKIKKLLLLIIDKVFYACFKRVKIGETCLSVCPSIQKKTRYIMCKKSCETKLQRPACPFSLLSLLCWLQRQ